MFEQQTESLRGTALIWSVSLSLVLLAGCDASRDAPQNPEADETRVLTPVGAQPIRAQFAGSGPRDVELDPSWIGADAEGANVEVGKIVFQPSVTLLGASETRAFDVTASELVIPSQNQAEVGRFSVGDVLVTGHDGGFWRRVEDVDIRDHVVIYRTREAELEEVFHEAHLVVSGGLTPESRETTSGEAVARQGLKKTWDERTTLETDFGSTSEMQIAEQDITFEASGTARFEPGYKIEIEIKPGTKRLEGKVFADANLAATWRVGINEGQAAAQLQPGAVIRTIPICSGSSAPGPFDCKDGRPILSFSFIKKFEFELFLEASYSWAGGGSGYYEGGIDLGAYVVGGLTADGDGVTRRGDIEFEAEVRDPDYDGEIDIETRVQLELGGTLKMGKNNPTTLLKAIPMRARLDTAARFRGAVCEFRSRMDAVGEVRTGGFVGTRRERVYDEVLFDESADLNDVPGCTMDNTSATQTCQSSGDCPDGRQCVKNYCVLDTPLQVSIDWGPDVDLDLYVENPDGEELELGTGPESQNSETGWIAIRTAPEAESSTSVGPNVELALFQRLRPQSRYRFWVRQKGAAANDNPIPYTLTVIRNGEIASLVEGKLSPAVGAESVRYVYNSGEVEGLYD